MGDLIPRCGPDGNRCGCYGASRKYVYLEIRSDVSQLLGHNNHPQHPILFASSRRNPYR